MESVNISVPVAFWKLKKPLKLGKYTITEYRYESFDFDQNIDIRLVTGANLIEKMVLHTSDHKFFHLKFVLKVVKNDGYSEMELPTVYIPRHLVPYLRQLIELIQTNQYENVFAESGYGLGENDDFLRLQIITSDDLNGWNNLSVLFDREDEDTDESENEGEYKVEVDEEPCTAFK